ncbi:MAG: response regulator [Geminicoccaceae bacterium]
MSDHRPLCGLRILVAEDNLLAAMEVEQTLLDMGCLPVGPVARLSDALEIARSDALDGAVLDLNLRDELAFPVAEELERRGVPLIFATGYDDANAIPERLARRPHLRKPYLGRELERLMIATFRCSRPGSA